jgi:hypothetical protein
MPKKRPSKTRKKKKRTRTKFCYMSHVRYDVFGITVLNHLSPHICHKNLTYLQISSNFKTLYNVSIIRTFPQHQIAMIVSSTIQKKRKRLSFLSFFFHYDVILQKYIAVLYISTGEPPLFSE